MSRKLASIQIIERLDPIPGADAIEVAQILGWKVVVRKGEFQVGSTVVYCEVDSLLPEVLAFESLRKSCYRRAIVENDRELQRAGFKIRTVKLRGQVSQGICFPLSILPVGTYEVGTDVTEVLGIIKWDPPVPACLSGTVRGGFPSFLPKTDETRCQILQHILTKFRGTVFYMTEKLDGSSHTVYVTADDQGACGRNLTFREDGEAAICQYVRKVDLFSKMRELSARTGKWYALQGELIGPGIAKNKYALREIQFRIFNVLEIPPDGSLAKLVDYTEMLNVVAALGLETVPQLDILVLNHTVDQLVELSRGLSHLSPTHREGVVFRPLQETFDVDMGADRVSFKAINPDFLLKYDD